MSLGLWDNPTWRVLSERVVILLGQAKTGGVVARKIRWDHKVLLELAGTVGSQAALADAYSVAVGQRVSVSTLNNHLYRDPDKVTSNSTSK